MTYQNQKIKNFDVQKLTGTINGYTGMLGMSLNYHSALVNLKGGYAQLLIQAIAKDQITTKGLRKAFSKYTKDFAGNIDDLTNANDGSLTNQMLEMLCQRS